MPMIPLAHVGHWAMYVLYAVPLVVVMTSIVVTTVRERRLRRQGVTPPGP
jgi:heme exporter protein D